jgi:hypothetical protein
MKIKRTKAWKEAEMEYEFLNGQTLAPFFDRPLSLQDIIDRLEMIIKGCPKFYPALLDLALRKLSSGGGKSVERQLDKGFYLLLELAASEHLDDELDILFKNWIKTYI